MKEIRALNAIACIAQSVERQPFKLVVVGSSPTAGVFFILFKSHHVAKLAKKVEFTKNGFLKFWKIKLSNLRNFKIFAHS